MLHTHEVTGSSPVVSTTIEDLCNGSTPDSDSVCGGSNPSSSAIKNPTTSVVGFLILLMGGIRTNLNARLRWSLARFRLDGIDTFISSNPSSSAKSTCFRKKTGAFLFFKSRPHAYLYHFKKGMRSNDSTKNHNEWTVTQIRSISNHLDIQKPLEALNRKDLEAMVESMRVDGLAHNSASSYCRVLRTFLNWCRQGGKNAPELPNIKDAAHRRIICSVTSTAGCAP